MERYGKDTYLWKEKGREKRYSNGMAVKAEEEKVTAERELGGGLSVGKEKMKELKIKWRKI